MDDNIYEQSEVMLVFLNTPDIAVQLDPQYAFITILDNDGMNNLSLTVFTKISPTSADATLFSSIIPLIVVTVQFVTGTYFVSEEATSLSVCMLKEGSTEVDINVMLVSLNDTTAEGSRLQALVMVDGIPAALKILILSYPYS